MKRGVGKRGLTLSEELFWKAAEIIAALLLILMMWAYIDGAVKGGLLAKQYYPGEIGLLSSVVAASPESMTVGTFVSKYDKTEFIVEASKNIITVTSNVLKGPSRFWVFTPAGTSFKDVRLDPATGVVHAVKEGNEFSLRKSYEFNEQQLVCPYVPTRMENALALRHYIVVVEKNETTKKGLVAMADLVRARMPNAVQTPGQLSGVALAFRLDAVSEDKNRVIAYYNAAASDDVRQKSRKLGCVMVNALQRSFPNDGMAVVPSQATSLPADVPGVEIALGQPSAPWLAKPVDLQKAVIAGVEAYYG